MAAKLCPLWFVMPGCLVYRGGLAAEEWAIDVRKPTQTGILTTDSSGSTNIQALLAKPIDLAKLSWWTRLLDRENVGASRGRALGRVSRWG